MTRPAGSAECIPPTCLRRDDAFRMRADVPGRRDHTPGRAAPRREWRSSHRRTGPPLEEPPPQHRPDSQSCTTISPLVAHAVHGPGGPLRVLVLDPRADGAAQNRDAGGGFHVHLAGFQAGLRWNSIGSGWLRPPEAPGTFSVSGPLPGGSYCAIFRIAEAPQARSHGVVPSNGPHGELADDGVPAARHRILLERVRHNGASDLLFLGVYRRIAERVQRRHQFAERIPLDESLALCEPAQAFLT